jgi:tripartite-type tricarboxylate transporter receptor subunit TctC
MIGLGAMARAKPDGYTLAMAINGDIVINPFLHKDMRFDPLNDFTPVALLAEAPQMLVSSSTLPVNTLQELITYAKARPGQVAYASTGVGSSTHLGAHMFGKLAGLSLNHVPYRGAAPAVNDLIAGHVQIMQLSMGPVAGQLAAGTIKALVVTAPQRWSAVPDVPSSAELGLPSYLGTVWFGLFAPAGLSAAIANQLNGYMQEMASEPAYRDRLKALFLDPTVGTPAAFKGRIEKEAPVWKQTVVETGATAD